MNKKIDKLGLEVNSKFKILIYFIILLFRVMEIFIIINNYNRIRNGDH